MHEHDYDAMSVTKLEQLLAEMREQRNRGGDDAPTADQLEAVLHALWKAQQRASINGQAGEPAGKVEPDGGEPPPRAPGEARVPPRDIERDPRDPGLLGQIDAYLNPPDAQRAAIELGLSGYVYTDAQAFGDDGVSGRIGQVINNETAVRKTAVHLDHERELTEQRTIAQTAPLHAIEAVAQAKRDEAIAAHEAKATIEHLDALKPELQAELADVEERVIEVEAEIEQASLIERIAAKVKGWQIAALGLLEGATQMLTLAPAYSAQAQLTFAFQDILTALMVGLIITLAATIAGLLLASLAPQRGAKALLIAALALVAGQLYRHIDALREGTDQALLFLTDASMLGALATCAIAFVLAVNKGFAPVHERLAALIARRVAIKDAIGAIAEEILAAKLTAHGVGVGVELIARELAGGIAAQAQVESLTSIRDERLLQEDAFGASRMGLARVAHGKAREEQLPGPDDAVAALASPPPGLAAGGEDVPGRGWLITAALALVAGVVGALMASQVLVFAAGCALAGAILIAALLWSRARRAAASSGTAGAAPAVETTVPLHDNPLWKRLPTSTYSRTRDGGNNPTQDI